MKDFKSDYSLVYPSFCRILNHLSLLHDDVRIMLVNKISDDFMLFRKRANKDKRAAYENRIRNTNFICEATKFRLINTGFIVSILETAIENYSSSDMYVIGAIVENIGRFLYLNPESHEEFHKLLEELETKILSEAKGSDIKQRKILNSIKFAQQGEKVRSHLQDQSSELIKFTRYLLSIIDKDNEVKIWDELLNLPWPFQGDELAFEIYNFLRFASEDQVFKT